MDDFFAVCRDQSRVKAAIVSKYFTRWAHIMASTQKRFGGNNKIAYIDLFAGPGRYDDGTKSTPLLVLETAIKDPDLRTRLTTLFNDRDPANTGSLQQCIDALPGIKEMKHPPHVSTEEIGDNIVKMFESMTLVPTLFFVDPWGYKGLSLRLVNSVIKDWGCDCIFFFNYNRINMGLSNPFVQEHVNALFGEERGAGLKAKTEGLSTYDRELVVVEELCQALRDLGPKYVLPFRFKDERGRRTSHHLIFVSKGFKGYEVMKEIMAKESSGSAQGVASFEFNPVEANSSVKQGLLFELSRPLDDLQGMLIKEYAGMRLVMQTIYEMHNVNRPYIKTNYKEALLALEDKGQVAITSEKRRPKGTCADHVYVQFS